jgi:hypothetical protein
MGQLPLLTMLAVGTVTFSAAAQERATESPSRSREAKTIDANAPEPPSNSTSTTTQDRASESAEKSRDAKTTSATPPTVDLKIEGIRNGLQIRVLPKEDGTSPDGKEATSCEQDCEVKLPVGSYTIIANQVGRQEAPTRDVGVSSPPTANDSESRHRLGHALGIGGIVAAAMGSYLAIGSVVARDGAQAAATSRLNEFFFAGLACIGIGGGLMIGGFSLAAANPATSTELDRVPSTAQRRRLTDMGVSVTGRF